MSNREVVPPTRQCEAAYGISQFFSVNQITVLPHVQYSSDATLRFFPLFPRLNCALKGHGYADIQGVKMTMTKKAMQRSRQCFPVLLQRPPEILQVVS